MTDRDPPLRVLRSLPLTTLLVTALFTIVWPCVSWLGLLTFPESIPPWPVWTDYLAIRAVAGVCVGASLYVVSRLPGSWPRMCLFWILFFVLTGGDVEDLARWSLGRWLSIWLVGSLIMGVVIGSVMYALERRYRDA